MRAVFLKRGRADYMKLASCKRRLEYVCRVYRALCRARTDQHMHLVDEQDDTLVAPHLVKHAAHSLLKLASVLRTCDHRGQIESYYPLAVKLGGNVAFGYAKRKPLDDGGLADAGVSDDAGIVLLPSAKNSDKTIGLGISADDGICLSLGGKRAQILSKLQKRTLFCLFAVLLGRALIARTIGRRAEIGGEICFKLGDYYALRLKNTSADGIALIDKRDKQMLGADKARSAPRALCGGVLDYFA